MVINDTTYYVSEIFESIQGEGNYAGVNSLFIRFQFCNLTCNWCDTKFSWSEKSGTFQQYTADELKKIISDSKPYNVIFTGGEPTLYRLDNLVVPGKMYHVESNASIIPVEPLNIDLKDKTKIARNAMDANVIKDFNWVISPKLSNARQKSDENSLKYWGKYSNCVFKFIAKSAFDFDEIEQVVNLFQIDKRKVYIGLEGFTLQSQLQPELVEEIIKHGYNYSPRLHIVLWGNTRKK
jgi:7-carboxy-7-deazaguanine synthase